MRLFKTLFAVIICASLLLGAAFCVSASADSITVQIEDGVNIRNKPTTSGSSIVYCTPSSVSATADGMYYDSSGKKWYHVTIPGKATGYACGDYVKETSSWKTVNVQIEDGVNIRSAPSASGSTVIYCTPASVSATSDFSVFDASGTKWYHVTIPGKATGYACGNYVTETTSGGSSGGSTVQTPTGVSSLDPNSMYPTLFDGLKKLLMVNESVNVRKEASPSSESIAYLWPCVLEYKTAIRGTDGNSWYNVITPGGLS